MFSLKGLILAGGKNVRFRAAGFSLPKPLVPVANRPVVAHLLDVLQEAGVQHVGVVVDNREGPVAAWPGWRRRPGMKFTFLEQSLPLGSAHAVKVAQGFVAGQPFVVLAGDCLIEGGLGDLIARHQAVRPAASAMVVRAANPVDYGVAELSGERVGRVVEKPQRPPGDAVLAGAYVFESAVFDAIDVVRPSVRNELELTAAIQWLIERGMPVQAYPYEGFWRDVGRPEAVLEANVYWLDGLRPDLRGEVSRTRLEGRVVVGERARVLDSTVIGPAIIGDGSFVVNSWIGPFTAVGSHVVIEDCEVERSVIMDRCKLRGLSRVEGSLVGEGSRVGRRAGRPAAYRLILGEGNEIEVP